MLCDKSKLIDVVEGILFVSGSGVAIKDIAVLVVVSHTL